MFLTTLMITAFTAIIEANSITKCLNTEDFVTKITKSEDLLGEWSMAHIKPLSRDFVCPSEKLKVVPVTAEDVAHWKNKCLHKLDISLLDETKFELQVTFPYDFETKFSIIRRDKNEDHILFPSCIFEKIEFVRKGDVKMWIATREEDGNRLPIAVSAQPWEASRTTQCILNENDKRYYFFC